MQVFPLYPNYHEANCYIAVCEDTFGICGNVCAVIDPGDNAERIFKRAENNGLTIEKIILTHDILIFFQKNNTFYNNI